MLYDRQQKKNIDMQLYFSYVINHKKTASYQIFRRRQGWLLGLKAYAKFAAEQAKIKINQNREILMGLDHVLGKITAVIVTELENVTVDHVVYPVNLQTWTTLTHKSIFVDCAILLFTASIGQIKLRLLSIIEERVFNQAAKNVPRLQILAEGYIGRFGLITHSGIGLSYANLSNL